MDLLIDTQILVWTAQGSRRLSRKVAQLLSDDGHRVMFSPLSLAEVAIKYAKRQPDFLIDPVPLRAMLMENGYAELSLTSLHTVRLGQLPPIHKDPFDRLMIAQALAEGIPFVTADKVLAGYPGQVIVV